MASQPGQQAIVIHVLPDISRSKGNQTMKFGQLIESNMKIFFLKNHIQNMVEKLVTDSFLKNYFSGLKKHFSGSIV